ncbi:hypothetical protein FNV43_RR09224 [Rhamnella rubrinervis]|uniref:CASP-like protein n=1 Tax=Rhamnella rubrinervis TaxID=2594499 RepID=A0A8K0HA27_9ROSA|nr:hypothetical protein FNV43_RR09224 [Rhamnella rubrinervis]
MMNSMQEEERDLSACRAIAADGLPKAANSLAKNPFPTPSPFSISIVSSTAGWTSAPSTFSFWGLLLRFLALVFSFVSALSLVLISSPKDKSKATSSFSDYPQLLYCFIVTILAFVYSAFQLFKGICDIAHRGILISDMISDYTSFILDQVLTTSMLQLVGYLLVSSSSVAVAVLQDIEGSNHSLRRATIVSFSTSLANFIVIATCALLSGYKLCKRIIW